VVNHKAATEMFTTVKTSNLTMMIMTGRNDNGDGNDDEFVKRLQNVCHIEMAPGKFMAGMNCLNCSAKSTGKVDSGFHRV
jgi:hypothetical protein